jgi:hypothetical protein
MRRRAGLDGFSICLGMTMIQRSFLFTFFASIAIFAAPCRGIEPSPSQQQQFRRVYVELDALFHRYYPNVTSKASKDTIHFEFNTRMFLIQEPLKSGEWQDARNVRGPNTGGILCDLELRKGKYLGAAAVPQTFDKRFFKIWVAAPYSVSRDEHLYVHLYYPADARTDFLEGFSGVVERFAR